MTEYIKKEYLEEWLNETWLAKHDLTKLPTINLKEIVEKLRKHIESEIELDKLGDDGLLLMTENNRKRIYNQALQDILREVEEWE